MRQRFILTMLILIGASVCRAQLNIMVNKGAFTTVQEGAVGEERVNFLDNDQTDDRACTECYAAVELSKFLVKATAIKEDEIRFVNPGVLPKSGNIFLLGSRFSNFKIDQINYPGGTYLDNEQSYRIKSYSENGRIVIIIEGADRIGTLYGVYRYLEEIGIKFIGLGEKGTIFPDTSPGFPDSISIIENPSYFSRGFYTWGDRKTDKEFFYWMSRNKFNYWTAQNQPVQLLKKLGVKLSDGGHRIQGVVFNSDDEYPYNHPVFRYDEDKPSDPYKVGNCYTGDTNNDGKLSFFEAHPEWYGMKNGTRIKIAYSEDPAQHGTNFCTSNEDARQEFAKRIVQQLLDGQWQYVDVFEFWMFDGGSDNWCTCDNCKAAGSFTDKMIMVTYSILKELDNAIQSGKLNRHIEVSGIAYTATLDPPTKPIPEDYDYKISSITFFPNGRCYVHTLADPACTELNQGQLRALQGWIMGDQRFYKGSIRIGEYYNIGSLKTLPVLFTKIMSVDIPWYYFNGANQFHYMHTPDTLWGTWTLNQYLLGKLLWNVNTSATTIVDDYFKIYYPTTSNTTRKFYEKLEVALANIKVYKHYVQSRLLEGDLFQSDHLHYYEYHPLVNDGPDIVESMDAMEMAKKFMEQSMIDCRNTVEQQRLLEDNKRFEYGYAWYRYFYHMIRTSFFHKTNNKIMAINEFAIVERYADQLREMVDVVQASSDNANSPNGLIATGSVQIYETFKKLYGK
jgi:hypothetical protein